MAVFNEIMTGRYNRLFQKLFSMKGGPPARSLSGEIMPVFSVEPPQAVQRYIQGWNTATGFWSSGPGGAGNISRVRLRNPAGSKVVAVIEKIAISPTANDFPIISVGLPGHGLLELSGVGASVATVGLDPRSGSTNALTPGSLSLRLSGQSNNAVVVFGTRIGQIGVVNNSTYDFIGTDVQELFLLPDCFLDVSLQTANLQFVGSFIWRERPMEDSELIP